MRRPARHSRGFTLVELIVSMVIAAVVVGFIGMMIVTPVEAYISSARRAELSDSAETSMRRIAGDVRKALPDSLRAGVIGGAATLDMIEISAIADYRTWTTADSLTIGAAETGFDAAALQRTTPMRPLNRMVVGHGAVGTTLSVYRPAAGVLTPETTTIQSHRTASRVVAGLYFPATVAEPSRLRDRRRDALLLRHR